MKLIKLGGAICQQPHTLKAIAKAWKERDEEWVILHGAGPQLTQALGEPTRIEGLRVTSTEDAAVVQKQMDLIGAEMAAKLRDAGVLATHVPSTEKRFQGATKSKPKGLGRVGTINAFERQNLPAGLPIVTPVAWDANGPLNVNADEGATVAASTLRVNHLVFATDVPGILHDGTLIEHMTPAHAQALTENGTIQGGMLQKTRNALEAMQTGARQVTIGALESAWDETQPHTELKETLLA